MKKKDLKASKGDRPRNRKVIPLEDLAPKENVKGGSKKFTFGESLDDYEIGRKVKKPNSPNDEGDSK